MWVKRGGAPIGPTRVCRGFFSKPVSSKVPCDTARMCGCHQLQQATTLCVSAVAAQYLGRKIRRKRQCQVTRSGKSISISIHWRFDGCSHRTRHCQHHNPLYCSHTCHCWYPSDQERFNGELKDCRRASSQLFCSLLCDCIMLMEL